MQGVVRTEEDDVVVLEVHVKIPHVPR